MCELLGLRWENIDMQIGLLHVRRTLNRLNKIKQDDSSQTTEIVLQPSKSQNSIRTIFLLPETLQNLQGWWQVQQQYAITAEGAYISGGFLVTNPLGGVRGA